MVKRTYKPYLDSPATVTKNPSLGEVTYYEYVYNSFNGPPRVSLAGKASMGWLSQDPGTFAYTFAYLASYVTETRQTSVASGQTLTSVTSTYAPASSFLGNMPRSASGPDGVKKSYHYAMGTFANGTFTGSSSGTDSYSAVITGCATASSETASSPYNDPAGYGITGALVQLPRAQQVDHGGVDPRSSRLGPAHGTALPHGKRLAAGEPRGLHVQRQRALTSSVKSNGATQSSVYSGQQKTSDTDETGVTKTYRYDNAGRLIRVTRTGFGGINALSTAFTYDAMDHVLSTTTGWGHNRDTGQIRDV
ncbi:MAG: hypothetical protein HS122_12945 [Opitutaceae bacterium]|nr:hypothetical protein [Opitutaceae bacterium]